MSLPHRDHPARDTGVCPEQSSPVPTQVQILAAFLAALGSGWVVLTVLFAYHFHKRVRDEDMIQRIAHRLATTPKSRHREFVDDIVVLEELGFFNRHKEEAS
ncbi:hypothetical protein PG987_006863 [Apiospora arundinis]